LNDEDQKKFNQYFFTRSLKGKICPFRYSNEFFSRNESTLFNMIFSEKNYTNSDNNEFVNVMKDVFGQKPNKRNLKAFFENEAIQALWWSSSESCGNFKKVGFSQSIKLTQILAEAPNEVKEKLINLFEKVAPAGMNVIETL